MPSPFPGMDPYLEAPTIWQDVHSALIIAIRDALAPQVEPAYYVAVEQRTYIIQVEEGLLVKRPNVAIVSTESEMHRPREGAVATVVASEVQVQAVRLPIYEEVRESFLEIRDAKTHEVVTVIELLSPANKVAGEGRRVYEEKRRQVLLTMTSLVEVDLLRVGEPMDMEPMPRSDYRILVRRGWEGNIGWLYAFGIRQPIPDVTVPLRRGEMEVEMRLGVLLNDVYDRARYGLRLDYTQPLEPPLCEDDAVWVDRLLREKGLR